MKKFLRFLRMWDGVWSIPISVAIFLLIGHLITRCYGPEEGQMSAAFIQRLFYAAMTMVFINFIAWIGIYTNFPGVFKYYDDNGDKDNFPADFKALTPQQRFKWTLAIYAGYAICFILILIFT